MNIIDNYLGPRLTTWGAAELTWWFTGGRMSRVRGTTLNEQYNIFKDELTTTPSPIRYWSIGYGTAYSFVDSNNVPDIGFYIHEPVDATAFHHIPFVVRREGEDNLTPEERKGLAGRYKFTKDGVNYIGYMLRVVDTTQTLTKAEMVVPATDNLPEQRRELVEDVRYLNPKPTNPDDTPGRTDGAYTDVTSIIRTALTPPQVAELLNAKQILTGSNSLYATEIGLYGGTPTEKVITDGSVNITYDEAICATMFTITTLTVNMNDVLGIGWGANHDLGIANPTNFVMWNN